LGILGDVKPSPEIQAIVQRLVLARASDDREMFPSLLSGSKHLRLIGVDESHWYKGTEVELVLRATDLQWPVVDIEILRLEAFEAGDVGWAALEERRTNTNGDSWAFRRTLIFELEKGAWKLVHSHFSAPVPSIEATGVDLTRTLAELLQSFGPDSELVVDVLGTATFLFTDVVDSTPMALQVGDKAWANAITAHLDAVRQIVETEGGSVVKTLGDGGMYVFESGSAALRAAKRIQQAVSESSEPEITVRVGAHTGDVFQTEDDYLGATVAKAARVTAAAEGGQILVSSTTAGLVNPSEFEFTSPITVELKGLAGTHQLQPLNWP
jgi:class 3 adenylate cyclase